MHERCCIEYLMEGFQQKSPCPAGNRESSIIYLLEERKTHMEMKRPCDLRRNIIDLRKKQMIIFNFVVCFKPKKNTS